MPLDPEKFQPYITGVAYPATKDDIVEYARMQDADREVLDALDMIPNDEYDTPGDVETALGETE